MPDQPQSEDTAPPSDREKLIRQAELIISQVLRGGVLLSAAIILVGVTIFYIHYFAPGGSNLNANDFPHSFIGVFQNLAHGDPLAIVALGLLVLLATPVLRVAVSIVAFALERDWRYVVITSLVLAILIFSFVLGRGGA